MVATQPSGSQPQASRQPAPMPRFECLDGLRAVAMLMVFCQHTGFLTGAMFTTRIGGVLARFEVGVPLFFAISGFLMFRPYAADLLDDRPFPDRAVFFWKRFWRIYPTYWVALLLIGVLVGIRSNGGDLPLHIFLLQIYSGEAFFTGIVQAWTLAVEVSFYLALPFGVLGLRRLVAGRALSQRAVLLLVVMGGLILLSLVWRLAIFGFDWPLHWALWLPGMIDYFAAGMSLAVIHVWAERRDIARPLADALGRRDLLWWVIAGGLVLFAAHGLDLGRGLESARWNQEIYRQATYFLITLVMLMPAVFGPQDRGVVRRFLRWRPIELLGVISYSFYLYHLVVLEEYISRHDKLDDLGFLDWSRVSLVSWDMLEIFVVCFAIAVALGTLSYLLVERTSIRIAKAWRPWQT